MNKQKKDPSKIDIIKTVMKNVEKDVDSEEMIHLILQRQFSKSPNKKDTDNLTFGQKAADGIAKFAGSWTFIIIFILVIAVWIFSNVLFLSNSFDPYPFIA